MRLIRLAAMLAVLTALGCWNSSQPAVIPTRELPPPPVAPAPEAAAKTTPGPEAMDVLGGARAMPENQFLAADKAGDCPKVHVTDPQGKEGDLQIGQAGYVTLVVVWTMEGINGPASFRHVADLARKYAGVGVRAVGIVERTASAQDAPHFADQQGVNMPLYYDNLKQSALRELTGEAGAKETRAVPSIFIVDRRLKLRFCRSGFHAANVAKMLPNGQKVSIIVEDAPKDQTIEHYLGEVLKETNW